MANPKSTAEIAGHPIHPMLVPFPIAFLTGTFVTDLVYSQTQDPFWAQMSFWLLAAALVMGALAAMAGLTDFLSDRTIRRVHAAWYHLFGNITAVVLALINFLLRLASDSGTYSGMTWLSLVVVLLLVFNGWKGWELVYRHHVGVSDETPREREAHTLPSGQGYAH